MVRWQRGTTFKLITALPVFFLLLYAAGFWLTGVGSRLRAATEPGRSEFAATETEFSSSEISESPAFQEVRCRKFGDFRMPIHPTAIVDRRAEVDPTAEIGPYVVIDGPVRIGARTRVRPFALLTGWAEIGTDCEIYSGAVVGEQPQDSAYRGDESYCRIGDGSIIREGASVHRGTDAGTTTVLGRKCFLMAGAHVAHNCTLGDEVKLANGAMLGGHVHVGAGAFISGLAGIHQFVRIGELVMLGGVTKIARDIPPYFMVDSRVCVGVNSVGLRRAGFTKAERDDVQLAYRLLYRSGTSFRRAVEAVAEAVKTERGRRISEFLSAPSQRGIIAGARTETEDVTDPGRPPTVSSVEDLGVG